MEMHELKSAWEQQKRHFEDQLISEEDILSVTRQDFQTQAKGRRFLYNASSFVFLLIFCQTC